jgi:oligosaccharide repeat unit polymerase
MLAFFLGTFLSLPASVNKANLQKNDMNGLPRFYYLTGILNTFGWILPLTILIRKFGISFLIHNPWVLQSHFQMQFIGYLNLIGVLVLPTLMIKIHMQRYQHIDLLFVTSALIGLFLSGIKSYLFYSLMTTIIVYFVFNPGRLHLKYILIACVLGLAFFAFYDAVIDIYVIRRFKGAIFPRWLNFLQRPYLYFVGSWPAMQQVVDGNMPQQPIFGYVTLQPIWKILGDGLNWIRSVPPYLPTVYIGSSGFNVFSFVGEVYWDYGLLGTILFSFLLSIISTRLYVRQFLNRSWVNILIYSLVMHGIILSFFMYFYRFGFFVIVLYVTALNSILRYFGKFKKDSHDARGQHVTQSIRSNYISNYEGGI